MTKQRPILFNATNVRAVLYGSKTQTRRVMKPQMIYGDVCGLFSSWYLPKGKDGGTLWPNAKEQILATCPYGQVGDQLWVKETTVNVEDHGYLGPVYAESDYGRTCREFGLSPAEDDVTEVEPEEIKLRPSLFMPRAASRITLEITSVRVERLQDISEADAEAEGCEIEYDTPDGHGSQPSYYRGYMNLWETINGKGSWDLNPLVWVIEFKKITQ